MKYERWHAGFLVQCWRWELHGHPHLRPFPAWALGRHAEEGAWAIVTPWFTVYL